MRLRLRSCSCFSGAVSMLTASGQRRHGRPWYFRRCSIFWQCKNSATPANGRHLVRQIFRHCSLVLIAQCAVYYVQSSCVLPRWMIYQHVARMSKRPPPNIHRYITKKRRHIASLNKRLDWTQPLFKSEEDRKQKALENEGKEIEPHMLHVVYLRKTLTGRPWWEKKIAEELQIEEVCYRHFFRDIVG